MLGVMNYVVYPPDYGILLQEAQKFEVIINNVYKYSFYILGISAVVGLIYLNYYFIKKIIRLIKKNKKKKDA